jgi:hypothetical protein
MTKTKTKTKAKNKRTGMIKINKNRLVFFIDFFESIVSILDKLEKSERIDILKQKIRDIIEKAHKNQNYEPNKLLNFINDFASLMISTNNLKTHIEKIALLCIFHHDVAEIYKELKILTPVVEYFYKNWETCSNSNYSKSENESIRDIIILHYFNEYLHILADHVTLKSLIDKIEKDPYLSSDYGLPTKRSVIIWIYDCFLSDNKNGIRFLEHFAGDPIIDIRLILISANINPLSLKK